MESLLTPAQVWKLRDAIKSDKLTFREGEEVILHSKGKRNYPRKLNIGDSGIVKSVEIEHVSISIGQKTFKIPKKLLVEKTYFREIKLKELLD